MDSCIRPSRLSHCISRMFVSSIIMHSRAARPFRSFKYSHLPTETPCTLDSFLYTQACLDIPSSERQL